MSDIFDDVEKMIAEENARKVQDEPTSVEATMEVAAEIPAEMTSETVDEEQIFNESELEDIMAEIESLENDFATPEVAETEELSASAEEVEVASPVEEEEHVDIAAAVITEEEHHTPDELKYDSSKHTKTDLQLEIEREIALIDEKLIASTADDSFESEVAVEAVSKDEIVGVKEEIPEVESTIIAFEKKSTPKLAPVTTEMSSGKKEMSFSASGAMSFTLNVNVGSEVANLYVDETKGLVINMSGVEVCLSDVAGCTVTMENGVNFNIPLTAKENSSKKKSA